MYGIITVSVNCLDGFQICPQWWLIILWCFFKLWFALTSKIITQWNFPINDGHHILSINKSKFILTSTSWHLAIHLEWQTECYRGLAKQTTTNREKTLRNCANWSRTSSDSKGTLLKLWRNKVEQEWFQETWLQYLCTNSSSSSTKTTWR